MIIIGICMSLLGCSNKNLQIKQQNDLSNNTNFTLISNFEYKHKIPHEDHSITFTNYDYTIYKRDSEDVSIEVSTLVCDPVSMECLDSQGQGIADYFRTSCKDSVKNAAVVESNSEIYTVTGEFPGYPCSTHECDTSAYGMDQFKGRYLLCSEHDGKTVVVEVNQVTPDPKMAEQIFSTFRWTE